MKVTELRISQVGVESGFTVLSPTAAGSKRALGWPAPPWHPGEPCEASGPSGSVRPGGPTLDVVVEGAVLVAVLAEKAEGVGVGEVLKLDEATDPKPVGREGKGHATASSSWSLAHCGRGGAGRGVRARLTPGVCATWRAPGLLALPTPGWRRMGKAEGRGMGAGGQPGPYHCL